MVGVLHPKPIATLLGTVFSSNYLLYQKQKFAFEPTVKQKEGVIPLTEIGRLFHK